MTIALSREDGAETLRTYARACRDLAADAADEDRQERLNLVADHFAEDARRLMPVLALVAEQTSQEVRMSINERQANNEAELEKYGIVTVPAQTFLWGGYRYTNAHDALAAAKRDRIATANR